MRHTLRVLLSFALVFGAMGLASFLFSPQSSSWYASLGKPDFTPPDAVIAPTWILIYLLLAIALARVWTLHQGRLRRQWFFPFCIQLLLNILWSILFFTFHSLTLAVVDALVLWFAALVLTLESYELDWLTLWLLVPYFAWITFALILTTAVWWVNG